MGSPLPIIGGEKRDKGKGGGGGPNLKGALNNCQKGAQIVTVGDHLGAAAGFVSLT